MSRRMLVVAIVLISFGLPLAVLALYVDDWSRDLTTNRAHTTAGSDSPPWEVAATPEAIGGALAAIADRESRWRAADEKPLPDDSPLPAMLEGELVETRHLVRTTGLMRYRDDVWLLLEQAEDGVVRLHTESRSRVGKGDMGQNPRNLRELRVLLDAAIGG